MCVYKWFLDEYGRCDMREKRQVVLMNNYGILFLCAVIINFVVNIVYSCFGLRWSWNCIFFDLVLPAVIFALITLCCCIWIMRAHWFGLVGILIVLGLIQFGWMWYVYNTMRISYFSIYCIICSVLFLLMIWTSFKRTYYYCAYD